MSIWTKFGALFGGNSTADKKGDQYAIPGNYSTESIKTVNEETSLQLSAVWACVRLLAETVGSLPLNVYENTPEGRKIAHDSPLHRVLHSKPNSRMTSLEFRETMMLNLCLYGNAFARIDRNARGQVIALWPLAAAQMDVEISKDGTLVYLYTVDTGMNAKQYPFEQRDILHIKLYGNGTVGLSPMGYARSTLGLSMASEEYASRFYANGGKPGGVLTMEQILNAEQRQKIRENFAQMHEGSANAHKLFVLEGGMKYQQVQINPEDAQMLETRRFQIEDVARWFGVPSFLINDNSQTTTWGSGIEQMMLGFYQLNLRPYLTRWEQALYQALLAPQERRKYSIEFNFEGLLRASTEGRASFYSTMVQNGLMTRNEARAKENLPKVDGGDELTAQINLAPIDQLGGQNDAEMV